MFKISKILHSKTSSKVIVLPQSFNAHRFRKSQWWQILQSPMNPSKCICVDWLKNILTCHYVLLNLNRAVLQYNNEKKSGKCYTKCKYFVSDLISGLVNHDKILLFCSGIFTLLESIDEGVTAISFLKDQWMTVTFIS